MPANSRFVKTLLMLTLGFCVPCTWANPYSVTTLTTELEKPWSIAELPEGAGFLVTEKPGRLQWLKPDGSLTAIEGVPPVYFKSQGGLLEVLLDPEFPENQRIYLSFSGGDGKANRTTVVRGTLAGTRLRDMETVLEVAPDKSKAAHYGGKLAFLEDGTLLVSVGEGFEFREQAQALDSELGKLLRINADGSLPPDNPFPEAAPRVFSYGHRNPQGLAVDSADGSIWMTEHGPKGGDELNRIEPGTNYGWPAITYGVDYSGAIISPYTEAEGMAQPAHYWVPSIALSGLAIYRASAFSGWEGSMLIGALKDEKLYRLTATASGYQQSEPFPEVQGRVRDVRVLDNGSIIAITDGGSVFHISPTP